MVRSKTRSHSTSPKKKAKITEPIDDDKSFLLQQSPPQSTDPNLPSPTQSTPIGNKRVFSGESYGHSSTETTPTKIVQAESLTQSLQNNLVEILINNIWLGQVDVLWARNREMYLDYRPHFTSSFRCRLEGNNGEADDRIIAKPDGALILVTNKKSDSDGRLIWSLQAAALAFEAKRVDVRWVEALTGEGISKAEAQAQSIAAQIWAEMLGMVCHPEYYKLGEQKAFVVHFSGFHSSIYYATFSPDYLSTIQHEGINALKSKFKDPVPLHHTTPCNLMNADGRLQFLKDFIAVVRCLADGNAPIGYLRRNGVKIHRKPDDDDEVLRPPQRVLDAREEAEWQEECAKDYAS